MEDLFRADIIKSHSFVEHPVKNYVAEEYNEYDIIGKQTGTIDFFYRGKFSEYAYCKALYTKLLDLSKNQITEFIGYQLEHIEDKRRWLFDLERFIDLNANLIKFYKPDLINNISNIILDKLKNKLSKNTNQNKLKWEGTDTDLLELVVALTQTRTIVNMSGESVRTEVIAVFEDLFGKSIPNPENTLQRAAARTKDKSPFLRKLTNTFETWASKEKKS